MTADAKIGLLLGLVFIFVIAFLLNGLPSLREHQNNNELTTNMVSLNEPPGLGAKERRVQQVVGQIETLRQTGPIKNTYLDDIRTTDSNDTDNQGVRFQILLPESDAVVKNVSLEKPPAEVGPAAPGPMGDKEPQTKKPAPIEPAWPKNYVVCEGDNLALIAQKFYGPQQGNKKKNILRIFQANRQLLKSPDEIYVGQKLLIPPPASSEDKNKTERIFPSSIFEKVKSIGQKHLSANPSSKVATKQARKYLVREGDSLWKIAEQQLGDGTRYPEIVKLNADILKDEDSLDVGMVLRLPAQ